MARGAVSKTKATEMILKAFPGSFTYDKEIRIPFQEDGEEIQLKCVLTCAKVNIEDKEYEKIGAEIGKMASDAKVNDATIKKLVLVKLLTLIVVKTYPLAIFRELYTDVIDKLQGTEFLKLRVADIASGLVRFKETTCNISFLT